MGTRTQPPIEDRIKQAFAMRFESTTELLDSFVSERAHAEELVILACSRLDALANLAMSAKPGQRERFVSFLYRYARRKELGQVAIPNLYFQLWRHFETLPGIIAAPGRLHVYDRSVDLPFVRMVVDSGLPITEEAIGKFLHYFSVLIQKRYRTTASQSRKKQVLDSPTTVLNYLMDEARTYARGRYAEAMAAVKPLLNDYTFGALLYREYRSGAIHEFGFTLDERFFGEPGLYVGTIHHDWSATVFLDVRVSAAWLVRLYKDALVQYERALLVTKRLPLALWIELCDIDELDYLDDASIDVGRDLRHTLDR